MSKRFFGMLVASCFAFASTVANADTPCGCGQVAAPCGDCYGSSVVSPFSTGGIVTDGSLSGVSYDGGVIADGGAGFAAGGVVSQGAIVGGGEVIGAASGGCCGSSVRYETRTIYQSQMTTQLRTVTRTRMRVQKHALKTTL